MYSQLSAAMLSRLPGRRVKKAPARSQRPRILLVHAPPPASSMSSSAPLAADAAPTANPPDPHAISLQNFHQFLATGKHKVIDAEESAQIDRNHLRYLLIEHVNVRARDQARRRMISIWNFWKISPFSTDPEIQRKWVCFLGVGPGTFEGYLSVYRSMLGRGRVDEHGNMVGDETDAAAVILQRVVRNKPLANQGLGLYHSAIAFFTAVLGKNMKAWWPFFLKGIAYLNPAGSSAIRGSLQKKDVDLFIKQHEFSGEENQVDADALTLLHAFAFRQDQLSGMTRACFEKTNHEEDYYWIYIGNTHKRKASIVDDCGATQESSNPEWSPAIEALLNRAVGRTKQGGELFPNYNLKTLRAKVNKVAKRLGYDPSLEWNLHSTRAGSAADAAEFRQMTIDPNTIPDVADNRIRAAIKRVTGHKDGKTAAAYGRPVSEKVVKSKARMKTIRENRVVMNTQHPDYQWEELFEEENRILGLPAHYGPFETVVRRYEAGGTHHMLGTVEKTQVRRTQKADRASANKAGKKETKKGKAGKKK